MLVSRSVTVFDLQMEKCCFVCLVWCIQVLIGEKNCGLFCLFISCNKQNLNTTEFLSEEAARRFLKFGKRWQCGKSMEIRGLPPPVRKAEQDGYSETAYTLNLRLGGSLLSSTISHQVFIIDHQASTIKHKCSIINQSISQPTNQRNIHHQSFGCLLVPLPGPSSSNTIWGPACRVPDGLQHAPIRCYYYMLLYAKWTLATMQSAGLLPTNTTPGGKVLVECFDLKEELRCFILLRLPP